MRDHNPDDWDDETWQAFTARVSTSPEFKQRAQWAKANGLPRPHPTEDGWRPTRNANALRLLTTEVRR